MKKMHIHEKIRFLLQIDGIFELYSFWNDFTKFFCEIYPNFFFFNFKGNKKGPIGRWDFDTAEEYADYMSSKEALPKAAFQYGVKMNEGRKTRGKVGAKTDKAKLDKEWNKISAIIDKRKTSGGGGGSMPKMPKYDWVSK